VTQLWGHKSSQSTTLCNHKCMWVWWKLSRHGSTWKNMAGRSIILFLYFFLYIVEDKPLCKHRLQKEISKYHIVFQTLIHMGHLWWQCCASPLNAQDFIRCYVYTCRWAWCTFARLLMWISWLFLKSSNDSSLLLNMKDNLSESCSQNPIYCMGCDFTCYSVTAIKWQGFDLGINPVTTLLCNQTCQCLNVFMWPCCNRNEYWLVLALHQRWTSHDYNMWWSNNNCWLRSCSHNVQCMFAESALQ
jgi:hypothetical protein